MINFFLLIAMSERIALIVTIAFLFTRWPRFRNLLDHHPNNREKLLLSLIFGIFGILGTYTGLTVSPEETQRYFSGDLSSQNAIVNSRAIGVIVAGLFGGPVVGLGAGLIAGIHRYYLGGFTNIACGFSSVFEGLLAGAIYHKFKNTQLSLEVVLITAILGEVGQMFIILLLAKPFYLALNLVSKISLPMIIANSLGIVLFFTIVKTVIEDEKKIAAIQAQKALVIADKTLSYLRTGLNFQSSEATARIIQQETNIAAVAITNQDKILAHVGVGSDHHLPGSTILTLATKKALVTGEITISTGSEKISCQYADCPLQSVVIAPLKSSNKTIGCLKLYLTQKKVPDKYLIELSGGLAKLFSTQLMLGEAEKQALLLQDAEIKALQAQINPHFLFNTLNTVISLIRTNPDEAREVLLQLGIFIRQNLQSSLSKSISLEKELDHVKAYLAVVQARFSHRLKVTIDIPQEINDIQLPPLTLQPLVENAVRHGFEKITPESSIHILAKYDSSFTYISVKDNGIGIPPETLKILLKKETNKTIEKIGLINVHSRLTSIFGTECGLQITSEQPKGTTVSFKLPIKHSKK